MADRILQLKFDTDNPDWILGFEAGNLWQRLQNGDTFDHHPFHTANIRIIKRMCTVLGCDYTIDRHDGTWLYLTVKATMV